VGNEENAMSNQIKPSRPNKRHEGNINLGDFGILSEPADSDWEDEFEAGVETDRDEPYSIQEDMESFMRENDLTA
jgi:hypothetical protein